MHIVEKLHRRIDKTQSLLCVGLDSDIQRLPLQFRDNPEGQFLFNRFIIDQTMEFAAAYKINTAFYESQGATGWIVMQRTMDYLHEVVPDVFTIMDAKRADIGNTSAQYAQAFYDVLGSDSITLHPWLGKEALSPFLERKDKAAIILCHTSNPGAHEVQGLTVRGEHGANLELWRRLARMIRQNWNYKNNCMLVVGATVPQVIEEVRKEVGDMTLLVPGIGAQGGDLAAVIKAGLTADKRGLLINASRSIIFADDPRKEAQILYEEIARLRR